MQKPWTYSALIGLFLFMFIVVNHINNTEAPQIASISKSITQKIDPIIISPIAPLKKSLANQIAKLPDIAPSKPKTKLNPELSPELSKILARKQKKMIAKIEIKENTMVKTTLNSKPKSFVKNIVKNRFVRMQKTASQYSSIKAPMVATDDENSPTFSVVMTEKEEEGLVKYSFNIKKPGDYNVVIYAYNPNDDVGGIYYRVNTYDEQVQFLESDHGYIENISAIFFPLQKGKHTIELRGKEVGMKIAKISLVAATQDFVPELANYWED